MDRKEIKDKLLQMGVNPRLLEMPAVIEPIHLTLFLGTPSKNNLTLCFWGTLDSGTILPHPLPNCP